MKKLELNQFNTQKLDLKEMKCITGGITLAGFA